LPPYQRKVNTVFQNYALFPNMNVWQNIAFGLQQQKMDKAATAKRVDEMIEMVQLIGFQKRKPMELSGGQQQRVAIARAVACNPDILLLDEPLGALDLKLRKQMQTELKNLHRELNKTFIYVTHDQEEALTMSDRIAVMNAGVLEQISTSEALYYAPQTKFVADFIGEANILHGTLTSASTATVAGKTVPIPTADLPKGTAITLFIRPEHITLHPQKGTLPGTLVELVFVGTNRKYIIEIAPGIRIVTTETTVDLPRFTPGQTVWVDWVTEKVHVFE